MSHTTIPTPFTKVLVANRGEIARRVIRSAKHLGYRTVAVYSDADRHALHVSDADQAVCIGGALPSESYLSIAAIIDAAKQTGADAIHPGYGFLAENAVFSQACNDAGIVFIGPSPESITAMGDKAGAKRLMLEAGVPCVPGYNGESQEEAELIHQANCIGFPIMIKATAGGGGRGMRLVHTADDFAEQLRSAKSEALSAFGNATVILEKAVINPRHIEIQIVADRYGHALSLGERDCSVQRRHQKVVEETPSPAVGDALRSEMGRVSVLAVQAIQYEGVGTLEFLLDQEGNFYFMEMNTRLQVEHPVTEEVLGLDLVDLQLRIAAGESLEAQQISLDTSGHAIEVRLCAEDVNHNFMPQSGQMHRWQTPIGLRVEHGLYDGIEIPPFYDSMLAKLIAHGRSRDEARRKLLSGLQDMVALGVVTNQFFLQQVLKHPVFAEGLATTAFIQEHETELLAAPDELTTRLRLLAGLAFYLTENLPLNHPNPLLGVGIPIQLQFLEGEHKHTVHLSFPSNTQAIAKLGEDTVSFVDYRLVNNVLTVQCDGVRESIQLYRHNDRLYLSYAGITQCFQDLTRAPAQPVDDSAGGQLRALMNGRIVHVHVSVDQTVQAGDPMITLEAMKMEHTHVAPVSGKIIALHVAQGEQTTSRRLLAEIEPIDN